jgi:hypothetical protein
VKHCFIGILRRGDRVASVTPGQVVVNRANGEVDIVYLKFDEAGMPRIDTERLLTITFGLGEVRIETAVGLRRSAKRTRKASSARKKAKAKKSVMMAGTF